MNMSGKRYVRNGAWKLSAIIALLALLTSPAGAVDKVKVAYIPVISFSGMYIAIEKGYMKEANQEWEMMRLGGGSKSMLPLAQDQIQVAAGTASGGFYNSIAKGAKVKVVADKGQINKRWMYSPLIVNKALWDAGRLRSPTDYPKFKFGQFGRASISEYLLFKLIEPHGIKYSALDLSYLSPPKQYAAMKSGAVKATMTVEPWAKRMELEGFGVVPPGQTDWLKSRVFQIAVIMYGHKFMTATRGQAQRWMNAYMKGQRYHIKKGIKDPEILRIISKWTKVKPKMIKESIPVVFAKSGLADIESMQEVQRWYKQMGYIKEVIPPERYIDHSFVKKAAAAMKY